ncbi:MAG: peroxiredoxin-like family protein [Desulfocapsaceae bacterium]
MLCRQQVAELTEYEAGFVEKQSRLAVIGPGEAAHLVDFRKVTGYRSDLFADPSRETFQVLGFSSGITKLIGIKPVLSVFSAIKSGIRPGSLQGNALQLGGAAVITPGNEIRYLFRESRAGDHPDAAVLLEAVSDVA